MRGGGGTCWCMFLGSGIQGGFGGVGEGEECAVLCIPENVKQYFFFFLPFLPFSLSGLLLSIDTSLV